jgi:hypothetical protein
MKVHHFNMSIAPRLLISCSILRVASVANSTTVGSTLLTDESDMGPPNSLRNLRLYATLGVLNMVGSDVTVTFM